MAADVPLWIAALVAAVGLVSPLLIARVSLSRPGGGTRRPSRCFDAARPAFQPLPP
jgi:hypothetical protein